MKDNIIRTAVCPLCGRTYHGAPALSREDNKTLICPDCGTRQALQSIGVDTAEQEQIIETIHRHMQGIHLLFCAFRVNMYTPKGKTKKNGGIHHDTV